MSLEPVFAGAVRLDAAGRDADHLRMDRRRPVMAGVVLAELEPQQKAAPAGGAAGTTEART